MIEPNPIGMPPFDISQLPQKVYLSGSDCFHLVLDKHASKNKAGGNTMHQLFYFDEALEPVIIQQILNKSLLLYWLCNVQLRTGALWKSPYWLFVDEGRSAEITSHQIEQEDNIPDFIIHMDISLTAKRFIEFNLLNYPSGKCLFIMSWNHIMMDGKGTSLLVNHLQELFNGTENDITAFFPAKRASKSIVSHVRNMYKVKAFVERSSKAPIASVAGLPVSSNDIFQFKTIVFTEEETRQIDKLAFDNGARFGANLYQLTCCAYCVDELLKQFKKDGVQWIPIPYDGRLRGAKGPIISNDVSFVFYRIEKEQLSAIKNTISYLSAEMAEQLKQDLPRSYGQLLTMMRHIPLWLYHFLISRTGEGSFASFLYSTTGNNYNNLTSLFGQQVQKLTVLPCPTYPPGLTFIFTKHNNALNISFSYLPSQFQKTSVEYLMMRLRQLLLQTEQ